MIPNIDGYIMIHLNYIFVRRTKSFLTTQQPSVDSWQVPRMIMEDVVKTKVSWPIWGMLENLLPGYTIKTEEATNEDWAVRATEQDFNGIWDFTSETDAVWQWW